MLMTGLVPKQPPLATLVLEPLNEQEAIWYLIAGDAPCPLFLECVKPEVDDLASPQGMLLKINSRFCFIHLILLWWVLSAYRRAFIPIEAYRT